MKYQLIKPINEKLSTVQQILTNRGIELSQIQHYLNTTDADINVPQAFGKQLMKTAAALIVQTVQSNKRTVVIVDCDCDGYTSAAVLINYLYDIFPSYVEGNLIYFVHDSKQHGLSDCVDWILNIQDLGLVICPDSSSNDYEQHKKLKDAGVNVIVLDHHDADHISQNAIIINNQLSDYPNKQLSGAGVTWQFCRFLDELLKINNAEKYRDLVALGLDADMMSLTNIQTKHLISTGLARPRNPFIVTMAQKNSFSLKGKLTPIGVAFYIAPFVNAMTRSGTIDQKKLLFQSMLQYKAFENLPSTKRGHMMGQTQTLVQQAVRVATNVKNRQTKAQDQFMNKIEGMIIDQDLLSHKVLLFLMQSGEIDRNIAGLVANKIMAKYQRPTCILTRVETKIEGLKLNQEVPWEEYEEICTISYAGSARGCDKTGINDFKSICLQTGVCNYAEGHPGAFGLSINEQNIATFIERTDQILSQMNDEAIYYVDYIYEGNNVNPTNILDIAGLEQLWGKDLDQPYVAIKGLKITPEMVTIYDKKGYTIKIQLQNNVSILKFNATEYDCEVFQTNNTGFIEVDIIGRCNRNQWNGWITPQIFMQDYQKTDSNRYYF